MTKPIFNIPNNVYNDESPINTIVLKDVPKAIRDKGKNILNVMAMIENSRTSNSIKDTVEKFPQMSHIFIRGNKDIPLGLYTKTNDEDNLWVGNNNFDFITDTPGVNGIRKTINGKSFEFIEVEDIKVWSERPSFFPMFFFDLKKSKENSENVLTHSGISDKNSVTMQVNDVLKYPILNYYLPYIITKKKSEIHTNVEIEIKNKFTFVTNFLKISREYMDGSQEVINNIVDSVLLHIKDRTSFVRISVTYDSENRISLHKDKTKHETDFYISENTSYQIALRYLNGNLTLFIDNQEIYKLEDYTISNKNLSFSICNDMYFGEFVNGSAVAGEVGIYSQHLTPEELLWIKNNPRSWNFSKTSTYLDLSIDEKIKLKELLNK